MIQLVPPAKDAPEESAQASANTVVNEPLFFLQLNHSKNGGYKGACTWEGDIYFNFATL